MTLSSVSIANTCKQPESQWYELAVNQPIPFVAELSCHCLRGRYLWIAVEEGKLIVLDEQEQRLFEHLRGGQAPAFLLAELSASAKSAEVVELWENIVALIARLAKAGFITTIDGYHDERTLSPEKFARLHLTRRCQLRCLHCYAMSCPEVDGSRELPTARWLRLIDEIADCGGESILFTGGEPLLRDDCPELMRHARERGLEVVLFTNGLLVEKRLPRFAEHVSLVQVGLNGPNAASNDTIRGRGVFQRAVRAVHALSAAGVQVRVGMTVMELNWPTIKSEFADFAQQFAGTSVRFHLGYGLCTYGRAIDLDDHLDMEEVRVVVDELLQAVNGPVEQRITRKTTGCGFCEQLVVAPDGVVFPCHLLDGPLGHIDERPLRDWHNLLRQIALHHQVNSISGCRSCDLRNLCGGTCRVVNQQVTGSKYITTCTEVDRKVRYANLVRLFT